MLDQDARTEVAPPPAPTPPDRPMRGRRSTLFVVLVVLAAVAIAALAARWWPQRSPERSPTDEDPESTLVSA